MSLIQLVYASRPFGFDEATLNHILLRARFDTARDDISGALVCRTDIYLQLLEGPFAAIDLLFAKIRADDRPIEVRKLLQRPVTARMFGGWSMMDDPAHSWIWDQAQVDEGAAERAGEGESLKVFERVTG